MSAPKKVKFSEPSLKTGTTSCNALSFSVADTVQEHKVPTYPNSDDINQTA